MKKLLLAIGIICQTYLLNAQFTWTSPVQIDDDAGTYPHLSFSPEGNLLVFYFDILNDSLSLKKELTPNGIFGSRSNITNAGKNIAIHFGENDTVDLMVAKGTAHIILQSVNGGDNWTIKKTITSTSNLASLNTMGAKFTTDDDNLRLFYTYNLYNPVTGDKPQVFELKRVAGVWENSGTLIADGAVAGAFENGTNICSVSTRNTFYSSNNGTNYNELNVGAAYTDLLRANDAVQTDEIIYMIRNYSSLENHIVLAKSTDFGATWESPQISVISSSTNYAYPKMAALGDTIVTCWLENPSTQLGINGYMTLLANYSVDGGLSWSNADTLFQGTNNNVITTSYDDNRIDIDLVNQGERFVIAYSTMQNNLANNQHTFIRNLDIPQNTNSIQNIDNHDKEVSLFPNPANESITITTGGNSQSDIFIYTIDAVIVKSIPSIDSNEKINLSDFENGIYIVKIQNKSGQNCTKLLINK